MNKEFEVSRKDLYDEVWSQSMVKLAKKYGISDVALAKRCRKRNIPMPGLGYWAKVQAGHNPRKKALPSSDNNDPIIIKPYKLRAEIKTENVRKEVEAIKEKVAKTPIIVVPEKLLKPHPLVKITRKYLKTSKSNDFGYHSDIPKECLDISVSDKQFRRALLIMDTLMKELEKRGFKMAPLNGRGRESTAAIIMDEKVHFGIVEIYDKFLKQLPEGQKEPTPYDYTSKPCGRLKLKIIESPWRSDGLRKTWSDGKCQKIENILNEFIDGMIVIAGKLHEWTLEQQESERKEKEERILRQKIIEYYEDEEKKVNNLMSDMSNWNKSMQLRAYIKVVKKKHIKGSEWIKWAYDQADRLDPLKKSPKSILDIEKPTLSWW